MARFVERVEDATNLWPGKLRVQVDANQYTRGDVLLQRKEQDQLGRDNGPPLEVDGLPRIIFQIIELDHGRVDELGDLGHGPLEVGEEGRIVEGPFRRLFVVPMRQREAVGDGEPVAVYLEVGGFAACGISWSALVRRWMNAYRRCWR